ncbi:TetR family transcriptional regulator [Leptobacterium flavescens]|uniref:TetR family transcriptional regulator n=1 Tax=Leptobacterium flavescens TaxID=472055 RepID=A0A6P0UPC3_9FLAO|nr:TetR/AcrR family transcriptional regulator [Leptobacterium flavescens]NER12206.1 TetR family transcriptional regulator [Leptobacterium flavescens]
MHKTLKHEAKADYLLEKGSEILWSRGYNGTSVNDIVKAAGVPKGSFYFYFDSKEDFAVKSLERYFAIMFKPAAEVLHNTDASPKQRLLTFYRFRLEKMKGEHECTMGCMACNLGNEMAEHSEQIRNTIVSIESRIKGEIIKVVEEAQQAGEIRSQLSPNQIVSFIEDAGKGALTTMKETQSPFPLDNYYHFIENVILK